MPDSYYYTLPIDGKVLSENMNYRLIAYSELGAKGYVASPVSTGTSILIWIRCRGDTAVLLIEGDILK